MAIRITYDGKTIDLLVGDEGLRPAYKQNRKQNRSASGKIETINFYGIQEMSFDAYFSESVYHDLIAWWSWARQGKLWAFAMDSGAAASTTLDGAAAAAQKDVPLTATTGFSAGDICLLRAEDDDDESESVEIDTVTAGVKITAVDNLKFSYAAGDTFRHIDYWPQVISLDAAFDPDRNGDTYHNTFKFVEAL